MNKDNQDELFVVVDEEDSILSCKTRFECHHNRNLIHRGVGVMIFNKKGEILMQKRSQHKDFYPGFWTISVGGHVGKGETYEQAAEREIYEELGIKIKSGLEFVEKFLSESDKEKEMIALFKYFYEGEFRINKDEVERIDFYNPEGLKTVIDSITPTAILDLKKLKLL